MKKNVLVTGASKGIGASLIKKFVENGDNVIIHYFQSEDSAKNLYEYIKNNYDIKVKLIKADITNEQELHKMFEEIHSSFGSLDILINNAAYYQDNSLEDKSKEEFMRVLEVNVFGTFLVTKEAIKYMNPDSIVINVSSTDADDTYNSISMDYCASKAGVNNLTKTFALALPNIKFIAVMLPWVKTEAIEEIDPIYLKNELERIHQKRLLEPFEVSKEIVKIINDKKIKSGSIIRIGSDD